MSAIVCQTCNKTAEQAKVEKLQRCTKCNTAKIPLPTGMYCGAVCQTADWPAHKKAFHVKVKTAVQERTAQVASIYDMPPGPFPKFDFSEEQRKIIIDAVKYGVFDFMSAAEFTRMGENGELSEELALGVLKAVGTGFADQRLQQLLKEQGLGLVFRPISPESSAK